jgi:two-component system sensor histidine kinase/response regulator
MMRLAASMAAGDNATALRLAHTLKGAGATLGADHLATLAARLEYVIRIHQAAPIPDEEIRSEIDGITIELRTLLQALPSRQALSKSPDAVPVDPVILATSSLPA